MTSYISLQVVYENTIRKLICNLPSETECILMIKTIREDVAREEEDMKRPDWGGPVSWMPGYGLETRIKAIHDFIDLRPFLSKNLPPRRMILRKIERDLLSEFEYRFNDDKNLGQVIPLPEKTDK